MINIIFYIFTIIFSGAIATGGLIMVFSKDNISKIELGKKIILYSSLILGIIVIIKAMIDWL